MYNLFLFSLSDGNKDFLKQLTNSNKILETSSLNQPLFMLGFHSFLHRTKNAMSITKTLDSQNNFYNIVNPFESQITDYSDDINSIFKKNILEDKLNVMSNSFYISWEILSIFDLTNNQDMTVSTLGDGIGSVMQSFLHFRKFFDKKTSDKIYNISIKSKKNIYDDIDKKFTSMFKKNIINHKTYTSNTAKNDDNKITGDFKDIKTINNYVKNIKDKIDLVFANAKPNVIDENFIEQQYYKIILGEFLVALQIQKKNGSFILRINETFTMSSIKILYLIRSYYNNCYIYKPFLSKQSESDKYIIFKDFKYNTSDIKSDIDILKSIFENIKDEQFLNDIFLDLEIPKDFLDTFKYVNIKLANTQQILINKIITYIKNNNYFGEAYHKYREIQIKSNKWWLDNFINNIKKLKTDRDNIINFNESELNIFKKTLN